MAGWRSWQRIGLITQESMVRIHLPLQDKFVEVIRKGRLDGGSSPPISTKRLLVKSLATAGCESRLARVHTEQMMPGSFLIRGCFGFDSARVGMTEDLFSCKRQYNSNGSETSKTCRVTSPPGATSRFFYFYLVYWNCLFTFAPEFFYIV